ncbi:rhomboid protein [Penicillium macrosclerotiorum]|uniref:rhomboid protein n=1 Tax=Penicillium macrosclerotiorum TaxID=303699 RepID=UPI0025481CBB|nr:rhomboid protein [Penicillium macrosclerotiorum]KAJ5690606.1 rhomboid protein [Penicillium macrosclerotiorum]
MAANEYYHTNIPSPPSYDQVADGRSNHLPTTNTGAGFTSHSPVSQISHQDDPSTPYHNRESQHSFQSENGAYATAGRVTDGDHYAENIPLKTQAPYGNNPEWMHQQTNYPPPSPGALEDRGVDRNGNLKKKGFFRKKPAWVVWTLTLAQVIVFIVELVKSGTLTGSPIEIHPSFNPMIGPSPYIQIYMGARYDPCMKNIPGVQNATEVIDWPCPNTTSSTYDCTLSDLCAFGGVPNPHPGGSLDDKPAPNQWFRFIVPIFLHGGFIHIGFNLLVQLTMAADMERMVGMWRFTLTYFASGIFGYVFGGNYASQLEPSTGCSGALFGILALFLLDLLYDWPQRESPWIELIIMLLGVAVSFVLGLLPGLDNFSHIGGFIMGLAMGLSLMRSPNALRERIGLARQPYLAMSGAAGADKVDRKKTTSFMDFFKGKGNMVSASGEENGPKGPLAFFKGRKPLWWAWWLVRAGALVAVLVAFIMLIVDFYKYPSSNCSWCYRLSCLPVKDWCDQDTLQSSSTTTST